MLNLEKILSKIEFDEHPLFQSADGKKRSAIFRALQPFAVFAEWEIAGMTEDCRDVLMPGALSQCMDVYVKNLSTVIFPVIDNFSKQLNKTQWLELISAYPSAERMALKWTEDFINYISDTVHDFKQFFYELNDVGISDGHGPLKCFFTHDADIHEGKYVNMLELENGERLVYKPRFPDTDVLLETVCHSLTEYAECRPMIFPRHLKTTKGTFYEYVESRPLEDESAFSDYFFNFGFMLFVQMILGACDYHAENIVADGTCPVAIDTETAASEFAGIGKSLSVRAIGMLPFMGLNHGYIEFPDAACSKSSGSRNLPHTSDGQYHTGYQHREEIEKGFLAAYNAAMKNREALMNDNQIKKSFCCSVRYVIQNTSYYSKVLSFIKQKRFLMQNDIPEHCLEMLNNNRVKLKCRKELLDCFKKAEIYAMTYGYIPKIVYHYEDEDNNPLFNAFCTRLGMLDASHRKREIDIIHSTLNPYSARYGADNFKSISLSDKEKSIDIDSFSILAEPLIKKFIDSYEKEKYPKLAVCGSEKQHYYVDSGVPVMAECTFGMIPFTGAWYKLNGSHNAGKLYEMLTHQVKESFNQNSTKAFTDGLAEGKSGMLLLADLMCKLGFSEDYIHIKDEMTETLKSQLPKKSYVKDHKTCSLLYGEAGILTALQKLPGSEKTEELNDYIDQIAKHILENFTPVTLNSGQTQGLGAADRLLAVYLWRENLCNDTREEIEKRIDQIINEKVGLTGHAKYLLSMYRNKELCKPEIDVCNCENLSFGNALTLTALTECGHIDQANLLAGTMLDNMLEKKHQGREMLNEPENILFPSFFFGYGGILYAMLRAIKPELPAIFKDI